MLDIDKEWASFATIHRIEKNFGSNPDKKFTFLFYTKLYNFFYKMI